ncbi:YhgE/Pip domain-containing protein [Shouchella sp. JSM 1781072]|uniref:YhgE/Pip domain-containing protein n=1 Tax=Shouchella sp. JSM 1781072 TaxID=3344581 RepID=UPI0035C104E4
MKKRWTIGAAVCVLMLTPLSYAAAETEGTIESKDEVIYANLFAQGDIEELYIVNALTVSEDGAISDFGHYDSITNLTDLSTIEQKGDEVKLEASTGTFHYQGNIQDNPELPWNFDIRYILDGDVVEPEDVIGQDGSFELEIDVTQNEDGNERFFENYLLQVSVPLNSEAFKDVDAPDATVANAGKNKQLAFTVMPEEEAELRISAEATDIELDGIEISALPSSFAVDMPDTDELTGEFDSLTGAIGDLANGVGELKTGIDGLSGGLNELGTGSAQFQTGLGELSSNGDELVTSSSQIQTGLNELNNALSQSDLNTDMDLSVGSELTDGIDQLVTGLDELSGGLTELGTHHEQGYLALEEAVDAIPEATLSEEDIANLYATTEDTETLDALVSSYTAAQTVKGTFEGVKEAFTSVKPVLNEMSTSTSEMGNGLSELSNSLSSLEDSFDFDSGLDELTTGIAELASQYGQFHEGLNSYTSGVSTVASEYNQIQNGIEESAAGSSELANGGASLHSGINELHDATAEIPEQMQQEIDEMISQYDKSDFEPVSFVHENNDDLVENVQFVIQTEPLTKDDPTQEVEEEEELSIWQRFLNLFRS